MKFPVIIAAFLAITLAACAPKSGKLFYGALGLGQPKIIITNGIATNYSITMYDINGNYLGLLADFTRAAIPIQSADISDPFNLIAVPSTGTSVYKISIFSGYNLFYQDSNINPSVNNIIRRAPDGSYYLLESTSNTIEKFNSGGGRVGAPYITTTVGGCTLNAAKGLTFTAAGKLIVANSTANVLCSYTVDTGNVTAGGVTTVAVPATTNVLTYQSTNDRIYYVSGGGTPQLGSATSTLSSAGNIGAALTATVPTPTAMAALPDGTLLIANATTVARVDTSANVLNANFIKNAFTSTIKDVIVIQGQ